MAFSLVLLRYLHFDGRFGGTGMIRGKGPGQAGHTYPSGYPGLG